MGNLTRQDSISLEEISLLGTTEQLGGKES